jgi:molybdopterin-synthase adenylyltransferase
LAANLARIGIGRLVLIDRDRVEEHNIGTQTYSLEDVGGRKAEILRNALYREVGTEVESVVQDLAEQNVAKTLKNAKLIVDAFDNSQSRQLISNFCRDNSIPCLHAGVNNEYGEIIWNDSYRVPSDQGVDACDYPLARNLILLVSTIAAESLIRFISNGAKESYSVTSGDLCINLESNIRG